jgi:hypothetical protein
MPGFRHHRQSALLLHPPEPDAFYPHESAGQARKAR